VCKPGSCLPAAGHGRAGAEPVRQQGQGGPQRRFACARAGYSDMLTSIHPSIHPSIHLIAFPIPEGNTIVWRHCSVAATLGDIDQALTTSPPHTHIMIADAATVAGPVGCAQGGRARPQRCALSSSSQDRGAAVGFGRRQRRRHQPQGAHAAAIVSWQLQQCILRLGVWRAVHEEGRRQLRGATRGTTTGA
jgi:hypothetical protein